MAFDNCDAFVVPFSLDETSVWKQALRYLSEDDETPVEAVCHSRVVSIDKEYYPVRRLEINYTAKWSAVSIFIEYWTEQETHYEQRIHYFDRFGEEHERSGFDYFDAKAGRWKSGALHPIKSRRKGYSGDAGTRPWTPREVTVPVTENIPCQRETGRKRTSGEVSETHLCQYAQGYPFESALASMFGSSDFLTFDFNSELTEDQKIPYSEEVLQNVKVIKQPCLLEESDLASELSKAKSEAKKKCVREIPGQEYASFQMDFDSNEVYQVWYYPVYHVIYEFHGQNYECFVSGYQKDSVRRGCTPKDASIESIKQQCDEYRSKVEKQKKKSWINFVWIWLGLCAYSPVFGTLMLLLWKIPTVGELIMGIFSNPLVELIQTVVIGGVAIYLCRKNYHKIKSLKQELVKTDELKNNIVPMRQAKKNALLDIVLDDSLSDDEKSVKCEAILKTVE